MIHFPPGTDYETRHRTAAWVRLRRHRGKPLPCWGFVLLARKRFEQRKEEIAMTSGTNPNNLIRVGAAINRETDRQLSGRKRETPEKLKPHDVLRMAGLTPEEVRARLDADRRRCA